MAARPCDLLAAGRGGTGSAMLPRLDGCRHHVPRLERFDLLPFRIARLARAT